MKKVFHLLLEIALTALSWIVSSIHRKMVLSYIIIILITLSIVGVFTYSRSVSTVEMQSERYNSKMLQLLSEKVDNYIFQLEQVSFLIYLDEIQDVLNNQPESILQDTLWQRHLNELFNKWVGFLGFKGNIRGITLIRDGKSYFHGGSSKIKESYDFKKTDWYNEALSSNGSKVLTGSHNMPYLVFPAASMDSYAFSMAKKINNVKGTKELGVLLLDMDLRDFETLLSGIDFEGRPLVLVINQNNKVIYDMTGRYTGEILPAEYKYIKALDKGNKSYYKYKISGEEMLVTGFKSSYTNWIYLTAIPVTDLKADANKLKNIIILIGILGFFIAVLISLAFSNGMLVHIKRLEQTMQRVESENFMFELPVFTRDEIGHLTESYNKMVRRIKELILTVYKVEIKEKEAHLTSLQSQINPHFLYNTLDTINAMAQIEGSEQISEMVIALSDLFKYGINQKDKLVIITDELKHLSNYVTIQKIRYGNRIAFYMDIPEELFNYKIIKLVIQPLVENAIYHGLETKEDGGFIRISGYKKQDEILITVEDNGAGIDEEKLDRIKMRLSFNSYGEESTVSDRSIGLSNVNERIKLYFGDKYGISINSSVSSGTSVLVHIPAIK